MKTKSFIPWGVASALLILLLSSCLNLNNYKPMEVERYHMGSVMVNDKPFEHVVYFSQAGNLNNPFLRSSNTNNMIYFPILLSPAGGNETTNIEYAILLCIDAKGGMPILNKPYAIAGNNTLLESASNSDEILRLFIKDRSKLLVNGAEGIAMVYDYANKVKRAASGTITFTSFDIENKNCTGVYTLKTMDPVSVGSKDAVLVFKNGTIATKISRESQVM